MNKQVIAIDIGASSGRLILGEYHNQRLSLTEIHRFENHLIQRNQHVCWDTDALLHQIKIGVEKAVQRGQIPDAMAIDTWGVDYVLLDAQGDRVGEAIAYRDPRTQRAIDDFFDAQSQQPNPRSALTPDTVYQETGIQFLPFNTLFQLFTDTRLHDSSRERISQILMIPDYLNYRLTGTARMEYTNASTTQMLNAPQKQWSHTLLTQLAIPEEWFAPPSEPFHHVGQYVTDGHSIPVISVASHDTASAVIGTPLANAHSAYLSSGTWSLMGIEQPAPVITPFTRQANITNEGGAEGRFRILKNIMGLWLIQNVQKQNPTFDFQQLMHLAEQAPPFAFLINPDDTRFLNPDDMQAEIIHFCQQTQQGTPPDLAAIVRCIYDSLALQYRGTLQELNQIAPEPLTQLHVVGGGSHNRLLNQLTADVCQIPVIAGPAEASAIGNILGQLIALGAITDVDSGRELVRRSFPCRTFSPQPVHGLANIHERFQQLTH